MAAVSRSACCRSSWRASGHGSSATGIVLVIVVVFLLPHLIQGFDPVGQALETVVPWAINLLLRLSGHDVGGTDVQL